MRKHAYPTAKPATRKNDAGRAKTQRQRGAQSRRAMLAAYYEKMLELQHGDCAICAQKFGRKLKLDQDPDSGMLRGLLCAGCLELIATIRNVWKYRDRFYAFLKQWRGEDYARAFLRAYRCDTPDRWERKQRASVH
jgi:Recombination endonuclease VII